MNDMNRFRWTDFYSEFATSLVKYADNRAKLIEKVKAIYVNAANMKLPTLEKDNNIVDIDPFTVFGLFNKGITNDNRIAILRQIKELFSISADVPADYDGIPVLNNLSATFYRFSGERGKNDIDNLWALFLAAISYADRKENKAEFMSCFDTVAAQKGVQWNITMALYWIRPMAFINLDARNRKLLENNQSRFQPDLDIVKVLRKMVSAENYLLLIDKVKEVLSEYTSFPHLSMDAYKASAEGSEVFLGEELTDVAMNTILYGPPGTGKTYNTVVYAVAVIENKTLDSIKNEPYSAVFERYSKYKAEELIEFTTFHQSYGYEEFIEGIKPIMDESDDERGDIRYTIEDGLFKSFCNKASMPDCEKKDIDFWLNRTPSIWKVSLRSAGDNPTRTECLENGHIRIGWSEYGPDITDDTDFSKSGGKTVLNSFIYKMKVGDIVFSCYSNATIDAIGVIAGDYEWCGDRFEDGLNRMRKVNWIVKGINENIVEINGGSTMTLSTVYQLKVSLADAMALIQKYLPATVQMDKKRNHVFIIDEINRGNISKIFGELITLIEPSKRIGQSEETKARLPYSQQIFGVPDNVYIIGTMNTADRSIATIDTALRRRFRFREMQPDSSVLTGIQVEDISISDMLTRMNRRISVLYDREHTIGHAYFIPLRDNPTVEQLSEIFENAILPLLQEYFYEDYEKIRLVLGDNNKDNRELQFISIVKNDYDKLFGSTDIGFDDAVTYEINRAAFGSIEAYRSI